MHNDAPQGAPSFQHPADVATAPRPLPWWKRALLWVVRPHVFKRGSIWFIAVTWMPFDWMVGIGMRGGKGEWVFGLFARVGPIWFDAGRQRDDRERIAALQRVAAREQAIRPSMALLRGHGFRKPPQGKIITPS